MRTEDGVSVEAIMAEITSRRAESATIGGISSSATPARAVLEERAAKEATARSKLPRIQLSKADRLALMPAAVVAESSPAQQMAVARARKVRRAKLSTKAFKPAGGSVPTSRKVLLEAVVDVSATTAASSSPTVAAATTAAAAAASSTAAAGSTTSVAMTESAGLTTRAISPAATTAAVLDSAWTVGRCVDALAAAAGVSNRNSTATPSDTLRIVPLKGAGGAVASEIKEAALGLSATLESLLASGELRDLDLVALVRAGKGQEWTLDLGK